MDQGFRLPSSQSKKQLIKQSQSTKISNIFNNTENSSKKPIENHSITEGQSEAEAKKQK